MLDRLSTLAHGLCVCIQALLHSFEQSLMLPSQHKMALDDTTRRCVATFRGNDPAEQADTRRNGPFEAERQLDAMAANALHVRRGSRPPIVRCVNRVVRNAAISADIARGRYRVPRKQLLDEMTEEMRTHLRPESSPALFSRNSTKPSMQRPRRARGSHE